MFRLRKDHLLTDPSMVTHAGWYLWRKWVCVYRKCYSCCWWWCSQWICTRLVFKSLMNTGQMFVNSFMLCKVHSLLEPVGHFPEEGVNRRHLVWPVSTVSAFTKTWLNNYKHTPCGQIYEPYALILSPSYWVSYPWDKANIRTSIKHEQSHGVF